jgi:hypothetical protein
MHAGITGSNGRYFAGRRGLLAARLRQNRTLPFMDANSGKKKRAVNSMASLQTGTDASGEVPKGQAKLEPGRTNAKWRGWGL